MAQMESAISPLGGETAGTTELAPQPASAVNPLGQPARPEEIGNAALFLLSDEAPFVTGAALLADGGTTA